MNSNLNAPKIFTGTDDFRELVLNSDLFIDKSWFIKEILEDSSKVILITRPRRWGKSLNMNMLGKFLEIEVDTQGNLLEIGQRLNEKLFKGGEVNLGFNDTKKLEPLKIATDETSMKHQGKYPVILLNLKNIKGASYLETENKLRFSIKSLYENHNYLVNSQKITNEDKYDFELYLKGNIDLVHLQNSLIFLSKLLFQHFKQQAYILVDEYDTPINSAYLKFGDKIEEFEQVLDLFRSMLGSALKSNPYLEKGLITGILRIAKANLFSDLNNVREYTLLNKNFADSYGFSQEEVDYLLTKVTLETTSKNIKEWYNGYRIGERIIYNPWSIMLCLSSGGILDHYWIDSGGTGLIDKVLLSDEMQEDLQKLAAGESIISPINKQISFSDINQRIGLLSLLLFSGYLNPTAIEPEANIYELSVPNKEVRYIYQTRVLQWVTDKLKIDRSLYYSFVTLLPAGKVEEFKARLQQLLHNSTSFHQTGETKAELFYSGFMLGLINTLAPSHIIESETETGDGRADIVLIPHIGKGEQAIIIEYKISKDKEDLPSMTRIGLNQIVNKRYDLKIKQHTHIKKILKISMAFCGKDMDLQYQIDAI